MREEISYGAALLRDLQNEGIPLSAIVKRILKWPPIRQNPSLRKRLQWELEGFPEQEETLVKELGRLVKRTGMWEPFFGPVKELERFIRLREETESKNPFPEPGSVILGKFLPGFLEDEEEVESAKAYLQRLRRFLAEVIVERYFMLTNRFIKHFDWML
ncbi:MAG: hypothetical protein DRG50_04165 [Deltaproteobacteria bacterium]|nr:MAG: hypothetical protein DRG50_04165 [Deltaproteobacteria bacterium]